MARKEDGADEVVPAKFRTGSVRVGLRGTSVEAMLVSGGGESWKLGR